MRIRTRLALDKLFTSLTLLAIALVTIAMGVILVPMLVRGATAVVFDGTVEFREMEMKKGRGDAQAIRAELERSEERRRPIYQTLDNSRRWLSADKQAGRARELYRDFKDELDVKVDKGQISDEQERALRRLVRKKIRDPIIDAYTVRTEPEAVELLDQALAHAEHPELRDTAAETLLNLGADYRAALETYDLAGRDRLAAPFEEVRKAIRKLLGPREGEEWSHLKQYNYGATRWDMSERALEDVFFDVAWVDPATGKLPDPENPPSRTLIKKRVPRTEFFANEPKMLAMFEYIENNIDRILMPETTFYWHYFTDGSVPGHYFGGVGPEIFGTMALTLLAIGISLPLGVISAAYLVEVSSENVIVKIIRTCINTLAGVPSIVFGLFGLAFFVLWLQPRLGIAKEPMVLAGGATLAVLVLPIVIRASEEAIRSVPRTYREAALGLGASRFRCFMTVTLPAAMPGILTGTILSMSRAAGETAPILFTAAVATTTGKWSFSLFERTPALSYGAWDIAVGDRIAQQVPHQQFGMVATLVVLVLLLNVAAILIRSRIARKLRGG